MKNISQYIMYGLMLIGIIVTLMAAGVDRGDKTTYGNADPVIYTMYAYFAICTVLALVVAVLSMINNKGNIKSSIIGLVAMAVVLGIGYVFATGNDLSLYKEGVTAFTSKMSGTGIYMVYVLFITAVGAIAFSSVLKMVRK